MFSIDDIDPIVEQQLGTHVLFDHYRLVDGKNYNVYDCHNDELIPQNTLCFHSWKRSAPCRNCISRLALTKNRQIIKLEVLDGSVFLVMALPVVIDGRHLALELIKNVTDDLLVTDADLETNVAVTDLVKKINELTVRDPATGLYNKEYAEHQLKKLVAHRDDNHTLVVIILDLDDFKHVNDEFGHLQGDAVIIAFSKLLEAYAQIGNGWASRAGGDEFMLVFPDLSIDRAKVLTDGLRRDLALHTFSAHGNPFYVTVSLGIAQLSAQDKTWQDVFSRADRTMYRDKQEHRK